MKAGRDEREKVWAESLSKDDKKDMVLVSLDEIEATRPFLDGSREVSDASFKDARLWVEKHRRLLKLLGHRGRIVVKIARKKA